ncbi:MAG: hypothetical protein J6Y60_10365 [Treponema sp.]|nr:hypothetical protein [Treponema sp.]
MITRISSARIDERGKLVGGKAGDQTGREVSEQNFYLHSKGWFVLRPKSEEHAEKIAERMRTACNNQNIGYDQNQRLGVIKNGIDSKVKTECDCSSLVRACVKEATGKDPGNFNTSNEKGVLYATGLFEQVRTYNSMLPLYVGDILVTKTKGHTVIVTQGNQRENVVKYYPAYKGNSVSFVDALVTMGIKSTFENRTKIAAANGYKNYSGTAQENTFLLKLLKNGKLKSVM